MVHGSVARLPGFVEQRKVIEAMDQHASRRRQLHPLLWGAVAALGIAVHIITKEKKRKRIQKQHSTYRHVLVPMENRRDAELLHAVHTVETFVVNTHRQKRLCRDDKVRKIRVDKLFALALVFRQHKAAGLWLLLRTCGCGP